MVAEAIATSLGGGACAGAAVAVLRYRRRALRAERSGDSREALALALAVRFASASRGSLGEVAATLDAAIRGVLPSLRGMTLWRTEADRFVCVFASGARCEHDRGTAASALDDASPLVLARRRGVVCRIENAAPVRPLHPADGAALAIPLDEAQSIAYLATGEIAPAAIAGQLVAYSELAAPFLRLAREREEDRERARFDGLTGLLTARAFRVELAERLTQAHRASASPRLALVFVDTDRFKDWNDIRGHAAGDDLLRNLAEMLTAHSAPADLVARNGGDEFTLAWCDCEKSSALTRAEALRCAIASAFCEKMIPITASLGVAAFPADASTAETLLEAADAAMYAGKRAGRNRVAYYGKDGRLTILQYQ
ncbi:MAG: GGDEF domain-containing protein [Candidatus Eremiobacteraeota bacterium]|nr:GGDEF domain-containing protein [Candidatus Eremiobacteraeota bacterium]